MNEIPSDVSLSDDIRRHDYDRYLCTLFAPESCRPALVTLLALNLELARIRERVSEPTLGRIRLTWWHETIEGVFEGKPRQHPVALALADVVADHDMPRSLIDGMIDAREAEFDELGFPSLGALERFAEASSGALHRLLLSVLNIDDPDAAAAAWRVGSAWALIGLARSVSHHSRLGWVYLPRDALSAVGLAAGTIPLPEAGPRIAPVVEEVVRRAESLLEEARALRSKVPPQALPVLLPGVLASAYARELCRRHFDPSALSGDMNRLLRQLRILWASFRKTY